MSSPSDYWRIGRLLKPWGRAGEWVVAPENGDPERFSDLRRVYMHARPGGHFVEVEIAALTRRGGSVMLKLNPDNHCAHEVGLYLPLEELPPPESDATPFEHELIGASLLADDGSLLGRILAVLPNPAAPLLAVDTQFGERLVPYVEAFNPRFSRKKGELRMTLPAGLIDEREALNAVNADPSAGPPPGK